MPPVPSLGTFTAFCRCECGQPMECANPPPPPKSCLELCYEDGNNQWVKDYKPYEKPYCGKGGKVYEDYCKAYCGGWRGGGHVGGQGQRRRGLELSVGANGKVLKSAARCV